MWWHERGVVLCAWSLSGAACYGTTYGPPAHLTTPACLVQAQSQRASEVHGVAWLCNAPQLI